MCRGSARDGSGAFCTSAPRRRGSSSCIQRVAFRCDHMIPVQGLATMGNTCCLGREKPPVPPAPPAVRAESEAVAKVFSAVRWPGPCARTPLAPCRPWCCCGGVRSSRRSLSRSQQTFFVLGASQSSVEAGPQRGRFCRVPRQDRAARQGSGSRGPGHRSLQRLEKLEGGGGDFSACEPQEAVKKDITQEVLDEAFDTKARPRLLLS